MSKKFSVILQYAAVFITTVILLSGILLASEFIPKQSMKAGMLSSANYLCEKEVFFNLWEGVSASKIDRYADSILLSIAYHTDSKDPLKAAMLSSFYSSNLTNENVNFLDTVSKDLPPNQQYLRYWHGSVVIVRLFHLFTDIRGLYLFHMVLLALLIVGVSVLLIKEGYKEVTVGLIAGSFFVSIWFVPLSLEYTWTVMTALEAMPAVLLLWKKKREAWLGILFMVIGMITAYMDFLTTETLTLTLPLILLLTLKKNDEDKKGLFVFTLTKCVSWGIGYVGMWVMKWIMASFILGENAMPYVTEHIAERMGTTAPEYIPLLETLQRNIICLFPMLYGSRFDMAVLIVFIVFCVILYLFRKQHVKTEYLLCITGLGVLPLIRYCLLRNHSYLHYFFTYRAQLATVLAICLIAYEMLEWRILFRGKK